MRRRCAIGVATSSPRLPAHLDRRRTTVTRHRCGGPHRHALTATSLATSRRSRRLFFTGCSPISPQPVLAAQSSWSPSRPGPGRHTASHLAFSRTEFAVAMAALFGAARLGTPQRCAAGRGDFAPATPPPCLAAPSHRAWPCSRHNLFRGYHTPSGERRASCRCREERRRAPLLQRRSRPRSPLDTRHRRAPVAASRRGPRSWATFLVVDLAGRVLMDLRGITSSGDLRLAEVHGEVREALRRVGHAAQ